MPLAKITTFITFESRAEEAAAYYVSIFKKSKLGKIARYPEGTPDFAGKVGAVMTVEFKLEGQTYIALNGGPHFKMTDAFSLSIDCKDQKEVDYFSEKLTADGGEQLPCGWVRDRFGVHWQVTPAILSKLVGHKDKQKAKKAMAAMMKMKKIDIAAIQQAMKG